MATETAKSEREDSPTGTKVKIDVVHCGQSLVSQWLYVWLKPHVNIRLLIFPASGSFLSSKDFENGAKYNEELGGQANSTKREHFEQAMRFHQVANAGERKKRIKTKIWIRRKTLMFKR